MSTSPPSHAQLKSKFDALGPDILKIINVAGTHALHLSVRQGGSTYQKAFTYLESFDHQGSSSFKRKHPKNVQYPVPTNENTIFPCCSLTKAATAAGLATLIGENFNIEGEQFRFSWDIQVKKIVPNIRILNDGHDTRLHHLLTHSWGGARGDFLWYGTHNEVRLTGNQSKSFFNSIERHHGLKKVVVYNNDGWNIAGYVLKTLVREMHKKQNKPVPELDSDEDFELSFNQYITEKIFHPLDMNQTWFKKPPSEYEPRVARGYGVNSSRQPVEVGGMTAGDHGFAGASTGLRTTPDDRMKFDKAWIDALGTQSATTTSTPGNPLKHVYEIMKTEHSVVASHKDESKPNPTAYGFGWVRTHLPARMGLVGYSRGMAKDVPLVVQGGPRGEGKEIFYHQGSFVGGLCAVILVPFLDANILVMSDTLALSDVASYVSQMALEELLEVPRDSRNRFGDHNNKASDTRLLTEKSLNNSVVDLISKAPNFDYTKLDYSAYAGLYKHPFGLINIEVVYNADPGSDDESDDEEGQAANFCTSLSINISGTENRPEKPKFLPLGHIKGHKFTWFRSWDSTIKNGFWPSGDLTTYVVDFVVEKGKVVGLEWNHHSGTFVVEEPVPGPVRYNKG
ncbi:hypothetical protein MKZ38_002211 [Zalerion maritima]|uniref:Beta-lactamase-related domain-containing protein n=1 Tax=Zalerion maritima TaxID=339359 RepID=A0AAD5RR04_9PEZI|nr:hypothetical protein MKZ38_002211 [Zalerion maritima]